MWGRQQMIISTAKTNKGKEIYNNIVKRSVRSEDQRISFIFSQSVTSSPAVSRKSSKTNIKTCEGLGKKGSKSNLIYDCDKSYNDRVSEDINDMVEQIQAIQNDISELAGRPISLINYKQ